MPDVSKVSTGKPKVGGAIYRAPAGTTPPTSADAELAAAYVDLGYASEDGVTNNNTAESDSVAAWGGDTVVVIQTAKPDEWGVTLLESLNPNVLKTIYGSSNVTTGTGTITVNATSAQPEEAVYVIDMALKGGALKRIVIPHGSITEVGEIVYKDDEPIGYELTIAALPDSSGVTHKEYIKLPSTSGGSGG